MRVNQPVTNVEIPLDDHTLIVSKTDLKGQITYINRDFLDISGFSEAELIGQPHNIVRHPDMPAEAFTDMWRDLKAGRPWIGLVKNRCKNGDYYWVLANASPIRENGQVVGYISVRRKASAELIKETAAAYADFREKRPGGKDIRHGKVVSGGLLGSLRQRLADVSSVQKIVFGMLLGLVLILGEASHLLSGYVTSLFDLRGNDTLRHDVGLLKTMVETNLQALSREAVQVNHGFEMNFPEGIILARIGL